MNIDARQSGQSRFGLVLVVAAVAVPLLVAILIVVWVLQSNAPPERSASQPSTQPAAAATPAPAAEAPVEPIVAPVPAPPLARSARKAKPAPAAPAASTALLKVDSDVPGASVFLDRWYLGTTPLTTSDVKPGSHVVQVAADGYESQSHTVEVTAGSNEVMARFKVVRLNETIPVIHKHGIGSCEGRLMADVKGLRYETKESDHSFTIPFSDLRTFEVDYLKKNLRVVRKDGRTFNFTDRNPNADALFTFHKKVEAARAKLSSGFTAGDK